MKADTEAVEAVNFLWKGINLMKEVGSGSELESEGVEKELEAEAIFLNQALPDFQTGYNRWDKT